MKSNVCSQRPFQLIPPGPFFFKKKKKKNHWGRRRNHCTDRASRKCACGRTCEWQSVRCDVHSDERVRGLLSRSDGPTSTICVTERGQTEDWMFLFSTDKCDSWWILELTFKLSGYRINISSSSDSNCVVDRYFHIKSAMGALEYGNDLKCSSRNSI